MIASALLLSSNTWAAQFTFTPANQDIADDAPTGLSDAHTIPASFISIGFITVTLDIEGGDGAADNEDFYVYRTHVSGIAIMLNRVRVTASDSLGYMDNGIIVTLDYQFP